jgi:hypothetical protein
MSDDDNTFVLKVNHNARIGPGGRPPHHYYGGGKINGESFTCTARITTDKETGEKYIQGRIKRKS